MANDTLYVAQDHELIPHIDRTLTDFLTTELLALGAVDPALEPFAAVARDLALARGKRLRPTFAYWGWRGATGADAPVEPLLPAFAALELMHTFALIHDDLMDAATTRRGLPAAHLRYTSNHIVHGWRGDADRFGTSTAVLAGDLCLVWADRLMGSSRVAPARLADARRVYDAMRVDAVAGQYLDVLGEAAPGTWSVDRSLTVARYKSASYTVWRPLQFGAALADGAASRLTEAYRRYGVAVGEAFQLRDDLLDVYGDPTVTGKRRGEDLRRGKPTVLIMLARRRATARQRLVLDDRLGSATLTSEQIDDLADLILATGAYQQVEHMIDERVRRAVGALGDAGLDEPTYRALLGLAVAATARTA
ncbi:MAG TPA: polyprenyl synthetase family protein [Micromonosporaceae bacterium]